MTRPCATLQNKDLGVLFANAVTAPVPTDHPKSHTIAKTGQHTIFELFTLCFRRCVRNNSRKGLSQMEMNQELEKHGFTSVRFRNIKGEQDLNLPKSFFRFSGRRWRDPDNFHDREFLCGMWPRVNEQAPVACSLQVLFEALREVVAASHSMRIPRRKLLKAPSPSHADQDLESLSQATTPTSLSQGAQASIRLQSLSVINSANDSSAAIDLHELCARTLGSDELEALLT